jgi:hypothetical protein|tara:strand:+ start:13 stop:507 length:495 start_codon:yes stop_codon:yes gene_type:complete
MGKRQQPSAPTDFGTPERWQHDEFRDEPTDKTAGAPKRRRVTTQTPLDRYHHRGQINQRQYDAGMKYYALHRRGSGTQRVTASYSPAVGKSNAEMSDGQAHAWAEFSMASREIGRQLNDCAYDVCVIGDSAGDWAKKQGADQKGGILVLRLALDALGDYFGMPR